jgi:hypothetical protein
MRNIVNWHAGYLLILGGVLGAHAGCAATTGPKTETGFTAMDELRTQAAKTALREDLEQFVDYAEAEVTATADQIERQSTDAEVRKAALLWKVGLIQHSNAALSEKKPLPMLLDSWAFCVRQVDYLQRGEGKEVFRDQQKLAISAAARLRNRIEEIARKHVPEDKLPEVNRQIESFAQANPVTGVFAIEAAKSFSADEEAESALSRIVGAPWRALSRAGKAGSDALDPTSRLADSVDRFTELMEDYPALVRWQTQLLWLQIEDSPSVRATVGGIEKVSESSARLATVAETLPEDVREEMRLALDDIDARQPEIRKTLEQARETVDATNEALERAEAVSATIESSVEGVKRAGEVWDGTAQSVTATIKQIQQLRKPRTAGEPATRGADGESSGEEGNMTEKKGKFDINDYTQTAESLTRTTEELRALLSEARAFLDDDTVDQRLSRVDSLTTSALGQTAVEARAVVDHIAWRAVQLCGLILVLAFVYRFATRRFVAKPIP